MKIVFCSSEVVPFAKTGGLADVAGALPLALENLGQEVIVVMPRYSCVNKSGIAIKKLKPGFSYVNIGKNIKVYFIENETYYNRAGLYGEKTGDYPDNLLRFSFYSRGTLDLLKTIDFKPDVIHCNDWQSALIPLYIKLFHKDNPDLSRLKILFTIHNMAYQGLFGRETMDALGIPREFFFDRIDAEINEAVKKAIMVCGQCKADLIDIDMPPMEKTRTVSLVIQLPEMLSYHSRYLPKKKKLYGKDLRAGMALGQFILAEHYIQAKRMVQWYRLKMEESFKRVDLIITPSCPIIAPKIGSDFVEWGDKREPIGNAITRYTSFFNMTGHPAISVPFGTGRDGLPAGGTLEDRVERVIGGTDDKALGRAGGPDLIDDPDLAARQVRDLAAHVIEQNGENLGSYLVQLPDLPGQRGAVAGLLLQM